MQIMKKCFTKAVKIPLILGEVSIIMIFQFYTILKQISPLQHIKFSMQLYFIIIQITDFILKLVYTVLNYFNFLNEAVYTWSNFKS